MFYFKAFLNSLYNFNWLKSNRKNTGQAGTYFVFFVLLISAVYSGYFIWKIPKVVAEIRTAVVGEVPDFKLEARDGFLSVTGVEQPYIKQIEDDDGEEFKFIIYTDTEEDLNINDYIDPDKESGVLLARDYVVTHQHERNKTEIQRFKDIPNFSFTKGELMKWFDKFSGGLPLFLFFLLLLALFVVFVISKLIYISLISLFVWIAAEFGKKEWKFSEIFTVGLYAVTLPTLINLILMLVGKPIPFVYALVLTGLILGAVFYGGEVKSGVETKD